MSGAPHRQQLGGIIILFADYHYSKSFGETTPHREAYRAHSSPNSPILTRLVKVPPLEGPARHIVHQTIWDKASERCHKVFRQLAQGTLWLTNTPMASSMAVEAQLMAVVQNRFEIYPLVEGPAGQVHPKTTTFCPVLGFTPSIQPSRAHQSQNDLGQLYSGPSVAPPVFPTYNVRTKNAIPRWFCS